MKTLILVDIQRDFTTPSGTLYVSKGHEVIPIVNKLMEANVFQQIIAIKDWHPKNHGSFAHSQGVEPFTIGKLNGLPQCFWPAHCVAGSIGSEFHPGLNPDKIKAVIHKGLRPEVDSYSGFMDNDKNLDTQTGLAQLAEGPEGNDKIYIAGIATDYCVKYTALDSLEFAYNTYLIQDGCRAVNINPDDGDKAIEEMRDAGVTIVNSEDLL